MFYWFVIALITAAHAAKKECPGGSFQCPDSATCCQLLDKTYGCCPLENAVCCDDHIHCCPMNTKCAMDMCVSNDLKNMNISSSLLKKNSTVCPGGEHICPDETTCCKGKDPLSFGCCPMKDAVCCQDGYHCCPADTFCDLATSQCVGKQFNYEMYDSRKHVVFKEESLNKDFKKISKSDKLLNVICPRSSFQCPNGYTCCELPSGDWGCCPFQNAQCCKDHLHCCPESFICDETSQACMKGYNNVSSAVKIPAEKIGQEVICPDKTPCSSSTTCCKIGDKHYGCCPYENATCCTDFVHCCPKDFTCDVEKQRCVPNLTVKWIR